MIPFERIQLDFEHSVIYFALVMLIPLDQLKKIVCLEFRIGWGKMGDFRGKTSGV